MTPRTSSNARSIPELMEEASQALLRTAYFEVETLCLKAMSRARTGADFDAMARITMPLQEARRQRRHEAIDAGHVIILRDLALPDGNAAPGCYLVEPPLVGVDARTVRDMLFRRKVPALVLAREPVTDRGLWPIVGVGFGQFQPVVVRVQVQPPPGDTPTPQWMLAAQEALGDAALLKIKPEWPADHRVEDVWDYFEAVPDHEKLSQAYVATCREAAAMPERSPARRRVPFDDPFSF
ncbi:MAG: hypothetical protein WC718_10360 [Phycisphaerales bacterium]|jgi:hypothetical protein